LVRTVLPVQLLTLESNNLVVQLLDIAVVASQLALEVVSSSDLVVQDIYVPIKTGNQTFLYAILLADKFSLLSQVYHLLFQRFVLLPQDDLLLPR
jgi:hypothetical protein